MKVFALPSFRALKFGCFFTSALCIFLLLIAFFRRELSGFHSLDVVMFNPLRATQIVTIQPVKTPSRDTHGNVPCPDPPFNPVGAITVFLEPLSWDDLRKKYVESDIHQSMEPLVTPFSLENQAVDKLNSTDSDSVYSLGIWSPVECRPKQTVAIIIPYRARDEHLRIFLNHMHGLFRHQQLRYTIFVIEQMGKTLFNRAALFNIGFLESTRVAQFDCFIFHDVDLLPQDDRIPYQCRDQPVHLSVAVDKFGYRLLYEQLFGGAVAFKREHFVHVRGFPNVYFGWGGEDDDMYMRVKSAGYSVFRYSTQFSRYTMIKHEREKLNEANKDRFNLLSGAKKRFSSDGYPETIYRIVSAGPRHGGLVYWISIDLAEDKIRDRYNLKP